tara:strand:- start:57 stop:596 length:540 start_codon:yes stop_codon:yes gene_type:complete
MSTTTTFTRTVPKIYKKKICPIRQEALEKGYIIYHRQTDLKSYNRMMSCLTKIRRGAVLGDFNTEWRSFLKVELRLQGRSTFKSDPHRTGPKGPHPRGERKEILMEATRLGFIIYPTSEHNSYKRMGNHIMNIKKGLETLEMINKNWTIGQGASTVGTIRTRKKKKWKKKKLGKYVIVE